MPWVFYLSETGGACTDASRVYVTRDVKDIHEQLGYCRGQYPTLSWSIETIPAGKLKDACLRSREWSPVSASRAAAAMTTESFS